MKKNKVIEIFDQIDLIHEDIMSQGDNIHLGTLDDYQMRLTGFYHFLSKIIIDLKHQLMTLESLFLSTKAETAKEIKEEYYKSELNPSVAGYTATLKYELGPRLVREEQDLINSRQKLDKVEKYIKSISKTLTTLSGVRRSKQLEYTHETNK